MTNLRPLGPQKYAALLFSLLSVLRSGYAGCCWWPIVVCVVITTVVNFCRQTYRHREALTYLVTIVDISNCVAVRTRPSLTGETAVTANQAFVSPSAGREARVT
jgi:hypothetical protein